MLPSHTVRRFLANLDIGAGTNVKLASMPSLNFATRARRPALDQHCPASKSERPGLPVWMYWEGPCPEWIGECRQTIFAHAPNVRLLSEDGFDRIWDRDRDLNLARLHVAQRADYIRAFVLARYGGLWIDSDCILTRSVQPVLNLLSRYDFVAHRERTALDWANDFMAAAQGSDIAAALYADICATLRSGRPLTWIALGGRALERVLPRSSAPWFELKCERIQPVCWSDTGRFFEVADSAVHERSVDSRALGYMLSNTTMHRLEGHRLHALNSEGTFFSYLINRALRNANTGRKIEAEGDDVAPLGDPQPVVSVFSGMVDRYVKAGLESISGPGSSVFQTREIRRHFPSLLREFRVSSLLDVGCGDCNWMSRVSLGDLRYVGVDVLERLVVENEKNYGSDTRRFSTRDFLSDALPQSDLILCRDCLGHLPLEEACRALRNFKASGATYLLTTTFTRRGANRDVGMGDWHPINLERAPFNFPRPLRLIVEQCSEAAGAFDDKSLGLWKFGDLPI